MCQLLLLGKLVQPAHDTYHQDRLYCGIWVTFFMAGNSLGMITLKVLKFAGDLMTNRWTHSPLPVIGDEVASKDSKNETLLFHWLL